MTFLCILKESFKFIFLLRYLYHNLQKVLVTNAAWNPWQEHMMNLNHFTNELILWQWRAIYRRWKAKKKKKATICLQSVAERFKWVTEWERERQVEKQPPGLRFTTIGSAVTVELEQSAAQLCSISTFSSFNSSAPNSILPLSDCWRFKLWFVFTHWTI